MGGLKFASSTRRESRHRGMFNPPTRSRAADCLSRMAHEDSVAFSNRSQSLRSLFFPIRRNGCTTTPNLRNANRRRDKLRRVWNGVAARLLSQTVDGHVIQGFLVFLQVCLLVPCACRQGLTRNGLKRDEPGNSKVKAITASLFSIGDTLRVPRIHTSCTQRCPRSDSIRPVKGVPTVYKCRRRSSRWRPIPIRQQISTWR